MFHSVLREEEALRLRALSYCLLTVSGMATPEEPVDVDGGSADVEDDATETETAQGNEAVDALRLRSIYCLFPVQIDDLPPTPRVQQ